MTISIKVLLFASAREAAGNVSEVSITMEDNANTSLFRKMMAEKYPNLANMVLDEDSLTLALNEEYLPSGEVINLKNGDTIALIPPISGG
jgi:molybdopterin converting factor subunit 1